MTSIRRLIAALALAAAVLFVIASPAHAAAAEANAPHYHPPNPKAILVQFIGFTILALILARFAVPILGDALRKRREGIKDGLEGLEREEARLRAVKEQSERALKDAERGSLERMEQAVKEGARMREQLVVEGDEAARRIAQKARLEVEIERMKMLLELRNEVVELSLASATGLLKTVVDRETQDKLVDGFLGDLETLGRAS